MDPTIDATAEPDPLTAPEAEAPRTRARRSRAGTQRKLDHLLAVAAGLIARKGYEETAIRDVGRETGVSLPGMYYYFKSKEDLLFQIQHRTFSSLVDAQEAAASVAEDPERRLRRLLAGHLAFYAQHPNEMKVCTFELESVRDEAYREVKHLRGRYYRLMAAVINGILEHHGHRDAAGRRERHLTLFVFGMLNWIFMWYDPERDGPVDLLADEMANLVLNGLAGPHTD